MDRFPKKVFIAGCIVLGLTVAMGWGGIRTMIKGQVKKQVRIINHTDQYTTWKTFPAPVYLSIHLFNVTNGKELANGAKPKLQEVGPYVYQEFFTKNDIEFNITTEYLSYHQFKEYYFQPELSKGSEDDMVTVMNVPFLGTVALAHNMSEGNETMKSKWNAFLDKTEEGLTVTHSVRELLFDGYSVEPLTVLFKDPDLEDSPIHVPDSIADGRFGFFKNKNGTDAGEFYVKSGRNKSTEIGKIILWNEQPELDFWKDGTCNAINGTDGTIFHPFLNESTTLYIFNTENCRSLKLVYNETINVEGLDAFRFRLAEDTFDSWSKNEENWCYCQYDDQEKCNRNGFTSLSSCNSATPLFVSQPHFLGADEDIINSVEGLNPQPENHSSFYDLNPMAGYIFKANKRLQYGIELSPYPNIKVIGKPTSAMVPIYWIQETIEPYQVNITFLKVMNWLQQVWNMVRYGFVGFGGMLMFLGLVLAFTRRNQPEDSVILVK